MGASALSAARLPSRVGVAVGIVAGTVLALQVLLTKLFGAVLFYHYAFLAISLALLGAGAAAIAIYIRPAWFERPGIQPTLAGWCATLSVLLAVVPALLVRLHYPEGGEVTFGFVTTLAAASVLAALPFFAAGVVIALAIRHYIRTIGRLYSFDLAGAGIGAAAIVPLLWAVDLPTLIIALGAASGVATALVAWPVPSWRAIGIGLALAGAGLTALSSATHLYHLAPRQVERLAPGPLGPVADRWTPISRVVGYQPPVSGSGAVVTYDVDIAPVPRFRRGEPHPDWRELGLGPQSIGYALTGPGHTLIIGGGGGRDIHNALSAGQREVDVIELNRAIRDVVDDDLSAFSGSPYSLPEVSTTIGDGRSTLAARDTRYDQIHIGFTNTLSGYAGYALTESNLYTLEAFDEYFDHLAPGGVLNVSRLRFFSGEEALRMTVLALEALRERGIEHPERNVVVVLGSGFGGPFGTVLAKLEPFTADELGTVRKLANERGTGVTFAPGGPYQHEWAELARSASPAKFCEEYHRDICPPTDDQPFFFNMTRLDDLNAPVPAAFLGDYVRTPLVVLLVTLGILLVLSLAGFVLPLAMIPRQGRPPVTSLLYFAAIGLGFLILEIVLIQRFVLFLGFPTYALSVVLASLLLFTGLGSILSGRWPDPRRSLLIALASAATLIAGSAIGLQDLLRALIDAPFAARIAIAIGLIAPLGLVLGMAMPIGLGRLSGLYPSGVPWAWGVNGIASVLASVLAVAVAITWGFSAATWLACACYLGALLHAAVGRWPSAEEAQPVREPAVGARL
jgi:hypothetical protein